MARRGPRSGWGEYVWRLYVLAYFSVVGFALLGDLSGHRLHPTNISTRASALAGLSVGVIIVTMGLSGFRAIAIRPTPAEIQFDLLSPIRRSQTLARPTAFSATSAAIGGALIMLAVMLTSPTQFGGVPVGRQVGYLGFAAGVAVVGFAAHLLVAQRATRTALVSTCAALGLTSAFDVARNRELAPLTKGVEWLRDGPLLIPIGGAWLAGVVGIVWATRRAERLPVELIARGSDVLDRATFALAGNDFRSLLLLQRSITHAWRDYPIVRFPSRLARRYPLTVRALRGLARWRYGRVFVLLATAGGSAAMLSADHATVRTLALAAAPLWVLGLILAEPFAQENDRRDALELLPDSVSVESRHVMVSWVLAFATMLAAVTAIGTVSAGRGVATAIAAASAATCASTITFRRRWKSVFTTAVAADPTGMGGGTIIIQMAWPAIVAFICIAGLLVDGPVVALAIRSLAVFGITLGWVRFRRPQ